MDEHVRPVHLALFGIVVIEPSALQLRPETDDGMHPFRQREIAFEPDAVAEGLEVAAVAERRTGSRTDRNFPVVPESVGNEARETRLLGGVLCPCGRGEGRDQEGKINFLHN